jgi:protein-tyrosine-phosphatase
VIRIHFICTGNVYRSRLAEAWCVSRQVPGIEVSSSGIAAGQESLDPISPWAAEVLARYRLDSFASKHWQPTTRSLVEASDVLVFMESEHHRFCADWIQPGRQRIEVWEIEDIGPMLPEEIPGKVERTFGLIRERTDRLIESLRAEGHAQAVSGRVGSAGKTSL